MKGGHKEERGRFFSVVPSDRTRDNGHQLKQEVSSEHQETLLYCENVNSGITWPESAETPSLEILKSCLDRVLGKLALHGLA